MGYAPVGFDGKENTRLTAHACPQTKTIIAGKDPVANSTWAVRNLLSKLPAGSKKENFDLDAPDSKFSTLDPALIDVA